MRITRKNYYYYYYYLLPYFTHARVVIFEAICVYTGGGEGSKGKEVRRPHRDKHLDYLDFLLDRYFP